MFFLFLFCLVSVESHYFGDRQTFFHELISRYQLPQSEAAIWNCLADHHSNFESNLKQFDSEKNEFLYGILQINGKIWCSDGDNLCGINCEQLLDDNLTDDIGCARKIYEVQGLEAWDAWNRRCQGRIEEYMPMYKNHERCQLARRLYFEEGIDSSSLATVVCIAEEESGFSFNSKGGPNQKGYSSYGIFRINGQWWCNEGLPSSQLCGVSCSRLLDTNVSDDIQCVRTIFNETSSYREDQDGFYAWDSYKKRCKDQRKNQRMIKDCFTSNENDKIFSSLKVITQRPLFANPTTERLAPWITIKTPDYKRPDRSDVSRVPQNGFRPTQDFVQQRPFRDFNSYEQERQNRFREIPNSGFRVPYQEPIRTNLGNSGFREPEIHPTRIINQSFRETVVDQGNSFRQPINSNPGGFRNNGEGRPESNNNLRVGHKKKRCWLNTYPDQKILSLNVEEDCFLE